MQSYVQSEVNINDINMTLLAAGHPVNSARIMNLADD